VTVLLLLLLVCGGGAWCSVRPPPLLLVLALLVLAWPGMRDRFFVVGADVELERAGFERECGEPSTS
jgi:hypothetical protein